MKSALFYALRNNIWYSVIAVTSVKEHGYRKGWHGRYVVDNTPTHGVERDLIGRFNSAEDAIAIKDEIAAIRAKYKDLRKSLEQQIFGLHSEEHQAINAVIKNV